MLRPYKFALKNILLLLADDLAARVILRDDPRPARPTINDLMRRGTTFTQVISSATMTTPCIASLMTGCYPFVNGVRALRGDMLLPNIPTLAQQLQRRGYRTHGLLTGPLWAGVGLERGFDAYEYRKPSPQLAAHWRDRIHALIESPPDARAWFIYAHFYDIHAPRQVAPEFNRPEFGRTLYERAVATLDRRFAEILGRVDWAETIVVLHADHGELFPETAPRELGEKIWQDTLLGKKPWLMRLGVKKDPLTPLWQRLKRMTNMGHGFNLSEGLVRVPLIIAGANTVPAGRVVADQVRQVDILPTLLELAGAPPPAGIAGRSLLPFLRGAEHGARPAYMETYGFGRDPNFFMRGLRVPQWKYIDSPTDARVQPQLYDLVTDPAEKRNVMGYYPDVVAELKRLLAQETTIATAEHASEVWTPDEETVVADRLRDLGYF